MELQWIFAVNFQVMYSSIMWLQQHNACLHIKLKLVNEKTTLDINEIANEFLFSAIVKWSVNHCASISTFYRYVM